MYRGMMSSLEPAEQKEFMRLLRKFVHLHDRQTARPRSASPIGPSPEPTAVPPLGRKPRI